MCALFQPLLGELRGSVAGNVFSKNAAGAYVRARTTPVNPQSPAQNTVRAGLDAAMTRWRTLTEAQRAGWANYAENTPVLNKLGQSIILAPNAWYNAINSLTLRAALGFRDDPPTENGRAPNVAVSFNNQETFEIGGMTDIGAGEQASQIVQFQWAGPFPQSVNFFNGPWPAANLSFVDPAGAFPIVLQTPATIGQRYFVRWRNLAVGFFTSPMTFDQVNIVAIPPP